MVNWEDVTLEIGYAIKPQQCSSRTLSQKLSLTQATFFSTAIFPFIN
jgi:hypothetical protein